MIGKPKVWAFLSTSSWIGGGIGGTTDRPCRQSRGPYWFYWLRAATLVNVFSVRRIGYRLLLGYVFGALLLWITSNATTLLQHYLSLNIPVDAMTAMSGAPLVMWLIVEPKSLTYR